MSIPNTQTVIPNTEPAFLKLADIFSSPKHGKRGRLPISRSLFLRKVESGEIPKPIKLSKRSVAWRTSDIVAYEQALLNQGSA